MKMFVAGKWVDKDQRVEVKNPFDGAVIDTVPAAGPDDVCPRQSEPSHVAGIELIKWAVPRLSLCETIAQPRSRQAVTQHGRIHATLLRVPRRRCSKKNDRG